jgi:CHAP domain/Putative peptidoglycan binding domain
MSDHEPAENDEVHVVEDDPAEERRKDELEAAITEQGEPEPEEEPSEEAAPGSAQTMIAEARKHVGYRESGLNDTKFNRWLGRIDGYPHGGYGYPWCSSFLAYCLAHSRNAAAGPRTAACVAGVAWFRARKRFGPTPKVGDFVYYGPGGKTHVELVAGVAPNTIRTIGGNTDGSLAGNYFNGNGVYEKTVSRSSSSIHGYGRPAYGSAGGGGGGTVKPITTIRSVRQQQEAVNGLGYVPPLAVDGEWGPKTEAGVKWLQSTVGATPVDGEWGPTTEAKYRAHTGT